MTEEELLKAIEEGKAAWQEAQKGQVKAIMDSTMDMNQIAQQLGALQQQLMDLEDSEKPNLQLVGE